MATYVTNVDSRYDNLLTQIPSTSKAYDRIIVVGSIGSDSHFTSFALSDFSNVGSRVDVVAPGENITTTDINNSHIDGVKGTSYAAPHVSGVAGMMYSVNKDINAKQVKADIIASGVNNKIGGYPLVDAEKAVAKALAHTGTPNYNEKTDGILMGRLMDKDTNMPIAKAQISIGGCMPQSIDLNDGYFEIILPAGNNEITFFGTTATYEPLTLENIDMAENEVKYINDITLVKADKTGFVNFQVKDATNNNQLSNSTIKYRKNWGNNSGDYLKNSDGEPIIDTTNSNGILADYRELESGYYTAEIYLEGYIIGYENFAVSNLNTKRSPETVIALLCPELADNECRMVLEWGQTPSDLDSYLIGPGFQINYNNRSYLNIANLDVDDTSSYGPETITLFTDINGTYSYYIHDFTNRNSRSSAALSKSNATVKFYYKVNGKEIQYSVPSKMIGTKWNVISFTVTNNRIDVSSIKSLNTITN